MRYRGRSGTGTEPSGTNGNHSEEPITTGLSETLKVKLHPAIYLAAGQAKMDPVCRAWHLLRHVDAGGTGCVAEPAFESFVRDHGLAGFSNLRRLWRQRGADLFWNIRVNRDGVKWIRYRSWARVARGLDSLADGRVSTLTQPTREPLTRLRRLAQWRALCYAPACQGKGTRRLPNPISRAVLRELSGRSTPTQIRYETEVGVRSCRNHWRCSSRPDSLVPEAMSVYSRCATMPEGSTRARMISIRCAGTLNSGCCNSSLLTR